MTWFRSQQKKDTRRRGSVAELVGMMRNRKGARVFRRQGGDT